MNNMDDEAPREPESTIRNELAEALREIARLKAQPARPRVADDLLILFGRIAGLILVSALALSATLAVLRPGTDITALAQMLNTQLSIIIGAVLGYAAHPVEKQP
jgi:hypothetical protein